MDKSDYLSQKLDVTSNITAVKCNIENLHKSLPRGNPNLSIMTQNIRSVHKSSNINDLNMNLSLL